MTQMTLFDAPARVRPAGVVYFATNGRDIKIGYTTSWVRRGGELKLTLLWSQPGSMDDEATFHQRFARYRIPGTEYFHAEGALLAWLDERVPLATNARAAFRLLLFPPKAAA